MTDSEVRNHLIVFVAELKRHREATFAFWEPISPDRNGPAEITPEVSAECALSVLAAHQFAEWLDSLHIRWPWMPDDYTYAKDTLAHLAAGLTDPDFNALVDIEASFLEHIATMREDFLDGLAKAATEQ